MKRIRTNDGTWAWMALAWVAAGGVALFAGIGCGAEPDGSAAANGPVRGDVTDVRSPARPADPPISERPLTVTCVAPLTDASGVIPLAPQPVTPASAARPAAVRLAPSSAKTVAVTQTHTVQRGETLYAIAKAHYGDGNQWRRLAIANPAVGPSLRVGQQIVVP